LASLLATIMRVIKALLTSIIILALVLGLGFLITREVMLAMTTSKVKQSLKQVRDIQHTQSYATECASKGSDRDEKGIVHVTQLRFTDSNSYVVEVVCNQREHSPIEVITEDLPPFVMVQTGKSGVRWGQELGMNFTVLKRTGSVTVLDDEIVTSSKPAVFSGVAGPPSECVSYGYSCCDTSMQLGQGLQEFEALDCPQDCNEFCVDRPIILSFSTQPYYNKIDRILEVSKNQAVVFSFVVSPSLETSFTGYLDSDDPVERFIASVETIFSNEIEEESIEVELDFGDGKKEQFVGMRGQVEHQYQCLAASCEYHAKLKVIKEGKIESYDSPQNLVIVKVN